MKALKLFGGLLLTCILVAGAAACGGTTGGEQGKPDDGKDPNPPKEQHETLKSADEVFSSLSESDKTCAGYDREKYLAPLWNSQVVYNETVVPYRDLAGAAPERSLAFKIGKVLEVRSNDLSVLYTEGSDYVVTEEGKLSFPQGTSIPLVNFDSIYSSARPVVGAYGSIEYPGRYLLTGQQLLAMQIYVSYIRASEFAPRLVPAFQGEALPVTTGKLARKESVNIVFYGDSITTGCASTGFYQTAPNAPIFSDLTAVQLKELCGYDGVNVSNCATGGWTAKDGVDNLSRVYGKSPDLVVLAFGMNDGGGQITNAAANQFYTNYITMIERIRAQFPQCEFMLVSSILPNPDATDGEGNRTLANHESFLRVAQDICEEYENDGIALCDVMSIHKFLLENKKFMDMGDNYNHPSDFVARIYAHCIVKELVEHA